MSSEPKAPGAPAIYLYREVYINDEKHSHDYYYRAKILSQAGLDRATVGVRTGPTRTKSSTTRNPAAICCWCGRESRVSCLTGRWQRVIRGTTP
jgi:hypothetical protein